jgi:hypothetical protein
MGGNLATIVLVLLGLFVALQVVARVARRFLHFPAPFWIDVLLDSPMRRLWQPPGKLIARSGIAPGMTVLEVGC